MQLACLLEALPHVAGEAQVSGLRLELDVWNEQVHGVKDCGQGGQGLHRSAGWPSAQKQQTHRQGTDCNGVAQQKGWCML